MTPESLVLRPSRFRSWALVLGSAVFVVGGVFMSRDGERIGLWIAGFFALCLLVGVVNALPSASELRLDRRGFVVRTLFRSRTYRWADVACFDVHSLSGTTLVTLTLHNRPHTSAARSLLVGNFDGALPDTYGQSAVALAALLEDWRAGSPRPADPREGTFNLLREVAQSARGGGGLLALKLAALFSFCGGPLFLSDVLDIKHRSPLYFAIPFAPVALLLFGALALQSEETDTLGRLSIEGGLVGAALLTAMNLYTAIELFGAPRRPDGGLMAFGIAVGLCTAIVYTVAAIPFLRRAAGSRP
jgi:hypothetical protein